MPGHESNLDALLTRAASTPTLSPRAGAALEGLELDIRRSTPIRRRAPRYVRAIAIGVLVVGALTAGAALVDRWLQQPPYQGLPDGWSRTSSWMPLDFTTVDGHESRCRTYVDFEQISDEQLATINEAISSYDWNGFGQRIYDDLLPEYADEPHYEAEFAVMEAAYPVLDGIVASALPQLLDQNIGPGAPRLGAYASTCRQADW
jgi:hypothetical protein